MGEAVKKDEEEQLIPVGPGAEGLETPEPAKEEEKTEDTRLAHDEEETEEKVDATGKRKESSRERRERAKVARTRERLEYNFLLKRNEDLEKRFAHLEGRTAQNETVAIDQRITNINAQIANADRILTDALRKPNGSGAEEHTEATKIRDQLRDQLSQLKASRQLHDSEAAASKPQMRAAPEEPRPDSRAVRNAREWTSKHDWFDFNGQDEESVIVRAIDERMPLDGFDPGTKEYWDELTERVKRRLPERFKKNGAQARANGEDDDVDDDDGDAESARAKPKAGPKFSSGGRERPLKKGEVYVSAERKQAMRDYGVWEDPVARNRMLKKYAVWDAEIASSGNRS